MSVLNWFTGVSAQNLSTCDFRAVFWAGSAFFNYLAVSSIPLLFLTLERCLVLNSWNGHCVKRAISLASSTSILAVYAISSTTFLLELPLQPEKARDCNNHPFTCILIRFRSLPQVAAKWAFSAANIILSIYFFTLLRTKRNAHTSVARNTGNCVITATILTDFFSSMLPNFISIVVNLLTGMPSGSFLGPVTTVSLALEAAVCATLYTLIFRRRLRLRPIQSKANLSSVITSPQQ